MSNTAPSSKLIPRLAQSARIIAAALGFVWVGYRPAEHLQAAADSKHRHAAMSMSRRSPDVSRSDRLSSSSMSTRIYGTTPAQGIFTRSLSISSPFFNIDTSPRNLLITVALTLARSSGSSSSTVPYSCAKTPLSVRASTCSSRTRSATFRQGSRGHRRVCSRAELLP